MHRNQTFNGLRYQDILHISAPYTAVLIGLYCFQNGWLALLLYHFQIVLHAIYLKPDIKRLLYSGFSATYFLVFVLPLLLFGPLLYVLFPYMTNDNTSLNDWLCSYGLGSNSLIILIPYFGIVHPVLEEIHWAGYRKYENQHWLNCIFFAGYHVLVLATLLSPAWLFVSFVALFAVAYIWGVLHNKLNGGIVPFLSHFVGDMGIILATYAFVSK